MQDRYAGDVGDFSKFQLLRELQKNSGLRLGISWYRFPDEDHNRDGGKVDYAYRHEYTSCEPDLTDALLKVSQGTRSVRALEGAGVLPPTTLYFSELIPRQGGPQRAEWFQRSLEALAPAEIVMADPDNGFLPMSVGPGSSRFGKYIVDDEVSGLLGVAGLVVVYHHFSRQGKHMEQAQRLGSHFERLHGKRPVMIRFRPYSPRLYVAFCRDTWAEELATATMNSLARRCPDFWQVM